MTKLAEVNVHPTAIVHEGAQLASGVSVGPYSIIGEHVRVGEGTVIGPHVVLDGHTTLGKRNQVFQFASIGSVPQDLKFKGEPSRLEIGDDNHIREYVTMNPGTEHGGMVTRVGSGNLFMISVHVAHDCRVGDRNVLANLTTLAGHVTIEDDVILGGMSGMHQFARVGTGAMLAGGSLATLDVPPYCLTQGDRARLQGLNVIGLRRRGASAEEIRELKRAYHIAFLQGLLLREAVEKIRAELQGNDYVERFAAFLETSERGVTRPAGKGRDTSTAEGKV